MKIYAISGLGADARLFDHLHLDFPIVHLPWEEIQNANTLKEYASLFLERINTQESFILMGVSMGGMICAELAKLCTPKLVIQISSAETKYELPKVFRIAGGLELLKVLPKAMLKVPAPIVERVFGSKTDLVRDYMKNLDVDFAKKAAQLICKWNNVEVIAHPKLKLKGDRDSVLPDIEVGMHVIQDAGHFMVYENGDEVSRVINERLKELKT